MQAILENIMQMASKSIDEEPALSACVYLNPAGKSSAISFIMGKMHEASLLPNICYLPNATEDFLGWQHLAAIRRHYSCDCI